MARQRFVYVLRSKDIKKNALEHVYSLRGGFINDELNPVWEVIIQEHATDRSLKQNALMWVILTALANACGATKDDMHDFMVDKLLPPRVVEVVDPQTGETFHKTLPAKTSKLTVKPMAEFITMMLAYCGELGIDIDEGDYVGWQA
jgi:hypothetical protein